MDRSMARHSTHGRGRLRQCQKTARCFAGYSRIETPHATAGTGKFSYVMVGVRHVMVARYVGCARSPDQRDDPGKRGENHTHDRTEDKDTHWGVAFRQSGKTNAEQPVRERENPPGR